MRRAEAAVLEQEEMEVGLLVKEFFNGPTEAVLQRMAGPGGRRPAVAEAREAARRARAAGGGRAPPPPRTLPAEARVAAAKAAATRAGRAEAALGAEVERLAQARQDMMRRRQQDRFDDELVAAAVEPVGQCRSLELRCTCDLLRAYLPMTRNTSATSIKHDHLLRWGGQMYYPEKACNDNYVRRRETPSLGGASAPESSSRDDRQEGSTP